MKATRHDPDNRHTIAALAHLEAARHAREQYGVTLDHAIKLYGDRHWPSKAGRRLETLQPIMRQIQELGRAYTWL